MSNPILGNLQGLTLSQYTEYKYAVATYLKVEAFNSNISTLRSAGNLGLSYYDFHTYDEDYKYKLGLMLLIQTNPNSTFTQVQKN